ncbi:hypothetical protein [Ferroplasma sp.]|uniref:hypothetical protein n=1 Tax=Ferroplasma sp. TaxID=2591003 RepID=UPI002615C2CA|nr:hypothetical protein [Ferroplasma sp.]
MISIEIPMKWGAHINEQLEAIRSQTYQDYETIVAVPEYNNELKDILKQYDVKIRNCGPNLLDARFTAHSASRGEYSLLLDETRIPSTNLLYTLSGIKNDIAIIGEADFGNNFWIRMSNLDKMNLLECNSIDMSAGFVLPRFFETNILTSAFKKITNNIDDKKFRSVIFEDHQLISFEAVKLSDSISIIKDTLIYHYGDTSLISIIKKYHRYGKSHVVLKGTHYEFLLSPRKRIRKICHGDRIKLTIFYAARGIPFLTGYYLF